MPINVLFLSSGLPPGGKERQLIEIIRNLDPQEFSCGIITFNKGHHYSVSAKKYSSYFRELTKRPTRLEPLLSIWKCFREFKPDLVHTWDTLSSFYCYLPCKFYHVPLIDGSIRDAGIDKGLTYQAKRFFPRKANSIIGNSNAGMNHYRVKGHVIYNSINSARFLPKKDCNEFNLLMTANFSDYKDQGTFLKAAVELVGDKTVDNVYLLGEGPHKKAYNDWITEKYPEIQHHFHFTGAVANVEEYLSICQIGVLCSTPEYSEGLSNSVLEYMAGGMVSIATNLGGSNEIIDDGKNGFLINPGDHRRITELVHHLKNDVSLQADIIEKGKKTIETKFSMAKNLEELKKVYKEIIVH